MRPRRLIKKSKWAIVAYTIYNNWRIKKNSLAGNREVSTGATHLRMTLSESLAYIDRVFDDYLAYSGISRSMLQHSRVLMPGPGDNMGVGLKFLTAGARQVVCLDRFYPKHNTKQQYGIYQALRERLGSDERAEFDQAVDLSGEKVEFNPEKLLYIHGVPIEEAEKVLGPNSFEFIVSRSVLEHLYDVDAAFSAMDRLLVMGGHQVHKVDFRDHGMFTESGFHPLTFLTIPELIYQWMVRDSGRPNRHLINDYRRKMAELGYEAQLLVTHIVGQDYEILPHKESVAFGVDYTDSTLSLLNHIRPRLQPKFRDMADEDLLVSGIFLVARKPNETGPVGQMFGG